jgi:hypothetical protein
VDQRFLASDIRVRLRHIQAYRFAARCFGNGRLEYASFEVAFFVVTSRNYDYLRQVQQINSQETKSAWLAEWSAVILTLRHFVAMHFPLQCQDMRTAWCRPTNRVRVAFDFNMSDHGQDLHRLLP